MKNHVILASLFLCSMFLFSQTNEPLSNGIEVNQFTNPANYEYCQIVGTTANLLGTKLNIAIDFGQERKFGEDIRLKGEDGKTIKFNSMIDALNYMGSLGWEFVQAYAITIGNNNIYHFLLKKAIE